ncbi:MAG: hypothetical protein ACT4P7_14175 [Gemmatimonadaceae bacterium]
MTRAFMRMIDALVMILLAAGSVVGTYNLMDEANRAVGWGQQSVVLARLVYSAAGAGVLWGWWRRTRWLRYATWAWGLGITWGGTAATAFYGEMTPSAVVPAFVSCAIIAIVAGWWINQRATMRAEPTISAN